jgi:cysteine-rich repeat protein
VLDSDDRRIGCDLICPTDAPLCIDVTCGNGVLEGTEACDDGNNTSGDGCEADCELPGGPSKPGGYGVCEAIDAEPGECLGGPCAQIKGKNIAKLNPTDTDLLNRRSAAHPDGDQHPDYYCGDFWSDGLAWDEATCVREIVNGQKFGVCEECGVDTMVGCLCPNPSGPEFGCGLDLTCIGERCYPESPIFSPEWMCTAHCDDIYGANSGYCYHDSLKGALCYPFLCDDPGYPVPYCDYFFGAVCDPGVEDCVNDSCCVAECTSDPDCTTLNYSGHLCTIEERCDITP